MTSLKSTLSMHSAEASTPAPAYGTSRISSSPCTVPSSPKGPWSTGNTQSAPSSPRPGSSATGSPSSDHVPSRAMRTSSTSWPASASPARTDSPDASETSCSDERPPLRTATLMRTGCSPKRTGRSPSSAAGAGAAGVRGRLGLRLVARARVGVEVRVEAPDRDDHLRAALDLAPRRRVLAQHDAVLVGAGDVLVARARREVRVADRVDRRALVLAGDVGHLRLVGRARHGEGHLGAGDDLRAARRALLQHGARVLVGVLLGYADLQPGVRRRRPRLVAVLAGDVGARDALAARRDRDR